MPCVGLAQCNCVLDVGSMLVAALNVHYMGWWVSGQWVGRWAGWSVSGWVGWVGGCGDPGVMRGISKASTSITRGSQDGLAAVS